MTLITVCSTSGALQGIGHEARANRLAAELNRRDQTEIRRVCLKHDPDVECLAHSIADPSDIMIVDAAPALWGQTLRAKLRDIRKAGCRVVAIDGPRDEVDLVIVPSFILGEATTVSHRLDERHLRWGWDYLLIDQRRAVASRRPGSPVLVLTGGSDAARLSQTLPSLLERNIQAGTRVTWVVGPHAEPPQIVKDPRLVWRLEERVSDLRPMMEEAAYALSVYGVSVLELLHHGVPSVVFSPYGNRDFRHLEYLERSRVALAASDVDDAVSQLATLMTDRALADVLATRSAAFAAQSGVGRIADAILALAANSPGSQPVIPVARWASAVAMRVDERRG